MTVDVPQAILDALTDVADAPAAARARRRRSRSTSAAIALPAPSPRLRRRRQRCRRPSRRRRAAAARRRRCDRQPERLGRHLGLLRLGQADAAHREHRRTAATTSRRWPARSAPAARWTRTPPMSRPSGSSRAMASLQYLGLPLPQDPLGGTLRYQTDHDEVGRATSCGPRTSRLMVKVLAEEAIRLGIPFYNHTTAVKILTEARAAAAGLRRPRRSGPKQAGAGQPLRPRALPVPGPHPRRRRPGRALPRQRLSQRLLRLARPGARRRDRARQPDREPVRHRHPARGLPLEPLRHLRPGAAAHLLGRCASGREHHFLADYYRTTQELASNIFRKGYQWPFHATRMLDFGSSLVDLAIFRETQAGRRVFMDFNRNPLPVPGDAPFSLDRLDDDVRAYLGSAGATQALPIDRLRHMNPLAIELYRRYKIDIAAEPLEFAVNNQHMNGGIAVDTWGRSSLPGAYAVGEAAGTHGVTRPGGAALNAGQVFGTRAAEHIAASGRARRPPTGDIRARRRDRPSPRSCAVLRPDSPLTVRYGARERPEPDERPRRHDLRRGRASRLRSPRRGRSTPTSAPHGIAYGRPAEAARALQWQQMALASEAVLDALDHFIRHGGGSRGARAIRDPDGEALPLTTSSGPLEDYRFRAERDVDRAEQTRRPAGRRRLHRLDAPEPPVRRDRPLVLRARLAGLADRPDFRPGARQRASDAHLPRARGRRNRRSHGRDGACRRWPLPPQLRRATPSTPSGTWRSCSATLRAPVSSPASAATGFPTPSSPRWSADGLDVAGVIRDPERSMGLYLIELDGVERSFHYWRQCSAARRLADDPAALATALRGAGLTSSVGDHARDPDCRGSRGPVRRSNGGQRCRRSRVLRPERPASALVLPTGASGDGGADADDHRHRAAELRRRGGALV